MSINLNFELAHVNKKTESTFPSILLLAHTFYVFSKREEKQINTENDTKNLKNVVQFKNETNW